MAYALDQFNTIAQDFLDATVYSAIFKRTPLLTIFTGQAAADQKFGKPGTYNLLGGRTAVMSKAQKTELRGSTFYEPAIESNEFGGATGVAYRGSVGQVQTVDITGAMKFPWTMFDQPMKVMKDDLDAASGSFKVVNLIQQSVTNATNGLAKYIAPTLFSGNPSSQSAKQLSTFIGLRVALDSGANYATYGNVDKTVQTELKPALYNATATGFNWSLIDAINAGDGTNPNGGAATLGNGVDLVIVNESLFYNTIKPMARADSYQIITATDLPEYHKLGADREVVMYGRVPIIFDPYCPAGTSSARSMMYGLSTESWVVQIHPDYDFKRTDWVDQEPITGERSLTSHIQFKARLVCTRPALNGLYTAVN